MPAGGNGLYTAGIEITADTTSVERLTRALETLTKTLEHVQSGADRAGRGLNNLRTGDATRGFQNLQQGMNQTLLLFGSMGGAASRLGGQLAAAGSAAAGFATSAGGMGVAVAGAAAALLALVAAIMAVKKAYELMKEAVQRAAVGQDIANTFKNFVGASKEATDALNDLQDAANIRGRGLFDDEQYIRTATL